MAICWSAEIKSSRKVDCNYEANAKNGFGRSAAHALFNTVLIAFPRSVEIDSFSRVNYDYRSNSKSESRGVLRILSFPVY